MTQIRLLASPHDRPSPVAFAVRWWLAQMRAFYAPSQSAAADNAKSKTKPRKPKHLALGPEDAFVIETELPPGSPETHRRALQLRLSELAPIAPADLLVVARAKARAGDRTVYALAMARRERLAALDADKRGRLARLAPLQAPDLTLRSPRMEKVQRRNLLIDAGLGLGLLAAIVSAASLWTLRWDSQATAMLAEARALSAPSTGSVASGLEHERIVARRAGAAFNAFADITAATPDTAWWTSYRWTPESVLVSLNAANAAATLSEFSDTALNWRVQPAGAIPAADATGTQTFDVRLHPRSRERAP